MRNKSLPRTEHPFYIKKQIDDKGEWKTAEQLKVGDKLRRPDDTWTQVTEIERDDEPITVYNYEVEDNHNYCVVKSLQ